jgi:hypothetical protein
VISSPQKLLLHCYLQHKASVKEVIITAVSEDWSTLGGISC